MVAVAALPTALPLRAASPALAPPDPLIRAIAPVAEPTPVVFAPSPAVAQEAPKPATTGSDSVPAIAAPTGGIARQNFAAAPAASPRQAAPPNVAPVRAAPAMPRDTGEARVRGEMIIRSGTDEVEARALADSLHAAGATVRPVRHGDITIYEVVMGLAG